jgi:hypothetical protein
MLWTRDPQPHSFVVDNFTDAVDLKCSFAD